MMCVPIVSRPVKTQMTLAMTSATRTPMAAATFSSSGVRSSPARLEVVVGVVPRTPHLCGEVRFLDLGADTSLFDLPNGCT